jgi:hypothetical protein
LPSPPKPLFRFRFEAIRDARPAAVYLLLQLYNHTPLPHPAIRGSSIHEGSRTRVASIRAVAQLDLTQEGHKGHEDKSFEQEERETAEVKIKKRS